MVCFQVINLLPKQDHPQVLAEKLDHVEVISKPWPIS